jgi:SNF2 family DNA or RNA helicase
MSTLKERTKQHKNGTFMELPEAKKLSAFERARASVRVGQGTAAAEEIFEVPVEIPEPQPTEVKIEPYTYTHSDQIDPPEDWQLEDMELMYKSAVKYGYMANWSEMGCKKTSTGLWIIQRLWKQHWSSRENPAQESEWDERQPNVWVCTTRSGKGTFFNLAPHILEGWYIFNITAQGIFMLEDGKQHKLKLDKVPEYFDMPTLVVTHFHQFSKSNMGQFLEVDGIPVENPDGSIAMKPWTAADHFVKREWDLCWLDEAHRIKDKDTKWTIVLKRSKDHIRTDTTGTGFINRPDEVWSLLDHMIKSVDARNIDYDDDPVKKEIGGFFDFRDDFCLIDDDEGYEKVYGIKPERKDDFRAMVRKFGPRRTLTEVMPHIKEPIFVAHPVDLNPTQRKMYDEIKTMLQMLDQKGTPINAPNVLALFTRLRGICAATPEVVEEWYDEKAERVRQKIKLVEPSSKVDALMEILDGLEWDEERKDPVVIFSNFTGTLDLIQARFERANLAALEMGFPPEYPYLWMKEEHSDQRRYEMWHDLFPTLEYRIFMSTLQLGGESITLTPAKHVIFIDRSWSPKDNMQGIGRIRRPGQEGQPIVININAANTIDGYIKGINDLKQGWFSEIFGEEE